jgi:hypothetical protein
VVSDVLERGGVPVETVFARIDDGSALATVKAEHEGYAESHEVWGVPTFIVGDQAVFIRFMHRATDGAEPAVSIDSIERAVDLIGWTDLNEFKHTSVPR